MLNNNVRPSTLTGIKRLAGSIKKERGIKYLAALDIASRAAGCENFRHAQRVLNDSPRGSSFDLYLTAYWQDTKAWLSGRETMRISLSKPISDFGTKSQLARLRGIGRMRLVSSDHFVYEDLIGSQSSARNEICKAVRSLQFMDHTGLRPSSDYRGSNPDGTHQSRLPDTDHSTDWCDPVSGQFVLVDEPYDVAPDDDARAAWAEKYNWHLQKAAWPGMYNPHNCALYVATSANTGFDFENLLARIESMPQPATSENWTGESVYSLEVFVTPLATTAQDRRRAKPKGMVTPQATTTTVPFNGMFGSSRRRPNAAMPVSDHIDVGHMVKAILHSSCRPYGVYRRIDALRSRLEDWMALEIRRDELDGPDFFEVYYQEPEGGNPYSAIAVSDTGIVELLDRVKRRLKSAYPDCQPLRQELNRIDASLKLMGQRSH